MNLSNFIPARTAGLFLMTAGLLLTTSGIQAINPTDTRLMNQPAISDTHIAFIYANDLWVANLDGSLPQAAYRG